MQTRLIVPLDGTPPYEEDWDPTQEPGYVPYEPPPPAPLTPVLWAVAYDLSISNGEISGIEIASRLAAALYLDVGLYLIFLAEPLTGISYFPKVYDSTARMRVTEKGDDYFIVASLDANGNPFDPASFNIEIIKVS